MKKNIALLAFATDVSRGIGEIKSIVQTCSPFFNLESASSIYKRNHDTLLKDARTELVIVCKIKTDLSSVELNAQLIQLKAERKNCEIILLTFNSEVQILPGLTLPHPLLAQDAAVLGCASEAYPEFAHPIMGKNLREIVSAMGYLENIEFHSQGNYLFEQS